MTMFYSVGARNAEYSGGLVTYLAASVTIKFYNGTRPASGGALSGNTLLGTLTFGTDVTVANGGAAGGVAAGVLTFGGYTQNNTTHVNGTPTWARISKSGGSQEIDVDIGVGAGNLGFSGSIVANQNITGTLTLTAGNVGP